jgi:hypothetical protein
MAKPFADGIGGPGSGVMITIQARRATGSYVAASLIVAIMAMGCAATGDTREPSSGVPTGVAVTPTVTASPTHTQAVTETPTGRPAASPSSDLRHTANRRDKQLADELIAYATLVANGRTSTSDASLFAPRVVLDVYERLDDGAASVRRPQLEHRDGWQVDALLNLADYLARMGESAYVVVDGRADFCASGVPRPHPRGYADHKVIALVADEPIESCLQWLAVDVYVDDQQRISYIRAHAWER